MTPAAIAEDPVDIVTLGPDDTFVERLAIAAPARTWVAIDGGMIRPLSGVAGFEPGLHDLLLVERDEGGTIVATRWATIDVAVEAAGGRDAYPLTYLVDRRPPRLEPVEPAFIRPNAPLPVAAYDESGIARLVYGADGGLHDVTSPHRPWPPGRHRVTVEAEDRAGNVSRIELRFEVDDTPPDIALVPGDRVSDEGDVLIVRRRGEVEVRAEDDGSGLSSLRYRVGDGGWQAVRGPVAVAADAGAIEFLATDRAGNERLLRREVRP